MSSPRAGPSKSTGVCPPPPSSLRPWPANTPRPEHTQLTRAGTATTGPPHCGYFIPAVKIAQFLAAGCDVTILIADIHGFLDSGKATLDLVEERTLYYEHIIPTIFEAIGIDTSRLRTVRGSSYQDQGSYFRDVLRLSSQVRGKQAKKAGAEVVKQDEDSMISASLYPLMQALDEEYLGVDAQFGGEWCGLCDGRVEMLMLRRDGPAEAVHGGCGVAAEAGLQEGGWHLAENYFN